MIDPVARATALAAGGRALLGIAGAPGSGKTTLAAHLAAAVPGAVHVPMDGFHLADVALDRLGRRDRKGAPDTFDAAGYLALLRRLRAGEPGPVYAPMFERDLEQPLAGAIAVPPEARLVVTEGNYLLLPEAPWPAVAAELTEVWFCDLREELRVRRLVDRHVRFGKEPAAAEEWVRRVDGPNAERVAATRDRAHLVVSSAVLETLGP
ncbi:nucleoside/nucleotide kinase family protein [Pseudonocardia kujensis]|uniref:nucleoside/nucleotide kinase family protein n=1 Tax=Pseudonocardia kujensis TaxID=1128675 RepID=UPI001E543C53|nr:nucleoside/nucleotide kinase family protein [Pseudonocardia kujensis]MCE0766636.1 nucleoside/nucleotide kinase family protein [Pseudonocardia kujensis]